MFIFFYSFPIFNKSNPPQSSNHLQLTTNVVGKVVFHNLILGKGFILIRDNLIIAGGMLVLLILFFAAMRQFFRKEKGIPETIAETKESNRQVVDNRSTLEWIQKQQKKEQ
jgi:hypothetical protein